MQRKAITFLLSSLPSPSRLGLRIQRKIQGGVLYPRFLQSINRRRRLAI
jgi:hypothetical protein